MIPLVNCCVSELFQPLRLGYSVERATLRLDSYAPKMSKLITNIGEWIDLKCHPSARPEIVRSIHVVVRRPVSSELQMNFRLDGDISRIRIPVPSVPRFNSEVWRHTCFEAFIRLDGQNEYHELNFAPSGEWAVFAFSAYRKGGPLANETLRPRIAMRSMPTRLELDAVAKLDALSLSYSRATLRIGLSAVIETDNGLSYWALAHPGEKPDFHNADGFALLLDAPIST